MNLPEFSFCRFFSFFLHFLPDASGIVVELALCAPVKWRLAGMLLREWRKCTQSAELILSAMNGIIIHCEAL